MLSGKAQEAAFPKVQKTTAPVSLAQVGHVAILGHDWLHGHMTILTRTGVGYLPRGGSSLELGLCSASLEGHGCIEEGAGRQLLNKISVL